MQVFPIEKLKDRVYHKREIENFKNVRLPE